jgi:predicted Rossmann fold flavoprotein
MASIAVIGGGPAGFMAAITAAEMARLAAAETALDVGVEVFDAGVPLATLQRTGGGRCNLANATFDPRALARQYPRGSAFLLSALSRFGAEDTMAWFQSRGLPLTVEAEARVFPRSGRAEDVRDLLAAEARRLGVRVRSQAAVSAIIRRGQGFTLHTARGEEPFGRVVLATGGDWKDPPGSGYRLSRSLGHATTPLAPSLCGLLTSDAWTGSLAGLSLHAAGLTARHGGRAVAQERGDLLFTHRGISGPLAFRISSRSAFLPYSPSAPLQLQLSPMPDLDGNEIAAALAATLSAHPRQGLAAALRRLAPGRLAELVASLAGADPSLPCSQLRKAARDACTRLLHRLPLAAVGREQGGEMVTAGGVALDEVDPRTMQSRLVPGLFFCGEVLDVDGFTGGYNLQAAWSTGRMAGLAAASGIEYL